MGFSSPAQTVTTEWFLDGTSPSLTVSATTAGTLLVMVVAEPNVTGQTFTFPAGWATYQNNDESNISLTVGWYLNNPGGITSVQITGVNNTADTHVLFYEFPCSTIPGFDTKNKNSGLASSSNPGSVTTTLDDPPELVISFLVMRGLNETGSPTYDSGFTGTIIAHDSSGGGTTYAEYDASSSSGTCNILPSTTTSDNWAEIILAFSPVVPDSFPEAYGMVDSMESNPGLVSLVA